MTTKATLFESVALLSSSIVKVVVVIASVELQLLPDLLTDRVSVDVCVCWPAAWLLRWFSNIRIYCRRRRRCCLYLLVCIRVCVHELVYDWIFTRCHSLSMT